MVKNSTKNFVNAVNRIVGWPFQLLGTVYNTTKMITEGPRPNAIKGYMAAALAESDRGGNFKRYFTSTSSTADAGHNCKVQSNLDLGAQLVALDPSEDQQKVVFDSFMISYRFESTKPFLVVPFLAMLENGETITATGSDENDPLVAIPATIAGTHTIKYGEQSEGKPYRDNGTLYYAIEITQLFTAEVRAYMKRFYKETIDEQLINPLFLGTHIYSNTDATQVTIDFIETIAYHFEEIRLNSSL